MGKSVLFLFKSPKRRYSTSKLPFIVRWELERLTELYPARKKEFEECFAKIWVTYKRTSEMTEELFYETFIKRTSIDLKSSDLRKFVTEGYKIFDDVRERLIILLCYNLVLSHVGCN